MTSDAVIVRWSENSTMHMRSSRRPFAAGLLLALLTVLPGGRPAAAEAPHGGPAGSSSCSGNLTLVLRPGVVSPASADSNSPPARDIPPGPLIERFPLYPGAAPSNAAMPAHAVVSMPPAYRKVARAEFQVPAGYRAVSAWYQSSVRACGLFLEGTMPLQQHGGPRFTTLDFVSPRGLSRLTLVFRPLSSTETAILYVAQTLDLPPRPQASYLNGPFTRVQVTLKSSGAVPTMNYTRRFTITWPATIARLVTAINKPAQIFVPLGGGAVISSQSAVLSFVREDGGVRKVSVGGTQDLLIVRHTRPLDDTDGTVLKLVVRITHHRCPNAGRC